MGKLKIKQVEYVGEKYKYTSPVFDSGLNIIEGKNGTGKSTLIGLICFALGIYVSEFDPKRSEIHKEICLDSENFVILSININNQDYTLKRYFGTNIIFVKDGEEVKEYPINRSEGSSVIFSDWIMAKLGFDVVEVYQGTKKGKINFSDVFRLIHYDQSTSPGKIYKEHKTYGNFVADSVFMRRVIFEILMGTAFSDYYSCIGKVIKLERERDAKKEIVENFRQVLYQTGFNFNDGGIDSLVKQLSGLKIQLQKAELHRENLKNSEYNFANYNAQLETIRKKLIDAELKFSDLTYNKLQLLNELKSISKLKDEIILEVTQIKKIIMTHEELNLFSPNTCPYCLRDIERKQNHCICGSHIEESEYEKFFYSSEEYLDILRSKQKSVETVENAYNECNQEYEIVVRDLIEIDIQIGMWKENLLNFDTVASAKNIEFNEANDKILNLKELIQSVEQNRELLERYSQFEKDLSSAQAKLDNAITEQSSKETKAKLTMQSKLSTFNKIYEELMRKISKEITKVRLDEDYMPVINDGEYREASSQVPKRFMYYISLLNMSLSDKEVLFPKFLLIDTPENLGIDKENLVECISQIFEGKQENEIDQFQIILTTGLGKYPPQFKEKVLQILTDDSKLLKEVESEKKQQTSHKKG